MGCYFWASELYQKWILVLEFVLFAIVYNKVGIGGLWVAQFCDFNPYSELLFYDFELSHRILIDLFDSGCWDLLDFIAEFLVELAFDNIMFWRLVFGIHTANILQV